MSDLLPFFVIGVTTGSVYGLAAMGLVLTYKTSGVFNFAHGAIAAVAAYAFYELHVIRGLPWPLALFLAVVVVPPVLAVVLERVLRGVATGTVTAKVVAAIGVQLAVTSALVAHYGSAALAFPAFLPTGIVTVFGINLGVDQLISAGIGAAGAIGFFLFFRWSTLGVKMRAVVDDPELIALAGTSPSVVRKWAWLAGCWFAALSGVLLAPQIGLDALLLTLLVVQAYGAAAIGRFDSLPLTYAGGLVVGVLAAFATKLTTGSPAWAGLPPAVPFLVLFAVLLLVGRKKLVEVGTSSPSPPRTALMSGPTASVLTLFLVGVAVIIPMVVGPKLPVFAGALVFVPIFCSLYLLVRVSGQISLAHAGLAAVGSAAFAHLAAASDLPWLAAVLLAGVVAVPVGAIVAVPAIRLSGLYLALATFGFGLLLERVAYRTDWMFGGDSTLPAPRPAQFAGDTAFYYVLLGFAVAAAGLVALIARSRLGRLLRALAGSPTTLSTLGLGVNVTRVTVFSISAFIAGVGGALYAAQGQAATGQPFGSYASLTWLAVLVISAGARSAAPVVASIALVVVPGYVTDPALLDWLPVLFGIGAVAVAAHEAAASTGTVAVRAVSGSRAAERIGAPSAGAERLRDLVARPVRAVPSRSERVRFGAATSEVVTAKGVTR